MTDVTTTSVPSGRAALRDGWLELALFAAAACAWLFGHGAFEAAPAAFEPRLRAANVVRLVTWNVGGAIGSKVHDLPDRHLEHIGDVLAALDADVIALQELGSRRQAERLAERLGPAWTSHYAGRGIALLARDSDVRLADDFDVGGRAVAAFVTVRGVALAVANVHANAFDARERNEVVGGATVQLTSLRGVDAHVLLGDLNLDVDLDKKRDLFSNQSHLDVETYNFVGRSLVDVGRGRGTTAEPDRRLDYIFVSPNVTVEAAGPWKDKRTGTMDHDPVVADVRS